MGHIDGEVRVDIIIVGNGIRRACLTLHHTRMLRRKAVVGIVGLSGMTDDSRLPHMRHTKLLDSLQTILINISEFSTTIFGNRAVLYTRRITIAEKSSKYLINNYFIHD